MQRKYKLALIAVIVLAIAIPVAFADEIGDVLNPPTLKVVYDGASPVEDAINTKSTFAEKVTTRGLAAKTVMQKLPYPYELPRTENSKGEVTVIKIQKCRYDEATTTMWYWIEATRDGKEVAVDSPYWVYPAPKDVLVSEVKDDLKNEITVTLKEDPQAAITAALTRYVDRQPLGKATVGTKQ